MPITKQWQFFVMAINRWMPNPAALFGYKKFACNLKGLGDPDNPRADFINWENTGKTLPSFHKVLTMGGACHEIIRHDEATREYVLWTFDGRFPPPLKLNRPYPETPDEVSLDDYLYNPGTHPWKFYWATIGGIQQQLDGTYGVRPFPPEETQPVMPFVGDYSNYTEVRIHEALVKELPAVEAVPNPYNPSKPLFWSLA